MDPGAHRSPAERIRAIRREAQFMRDSAPEDATGRVRVEPPGNGQTIKAAVTFWKLAVCVAAVVAGTIGATNWIESRIKDRIAPVEYRLQRIEDKVDLVLERMPR